MTEFEKMLAGDDFDGGDQGINKIRNNAAHLLMTLNQTIDDTQRSELLEPVDGGTCQPQVSSAPLSTANSVKPSSSANRHSSI